MAIEKKALEAAAARLALLPFFPQGEVSMALVMNELERIVHTTDRLTWLIDTIMARCAKWEGVAQIRALYSTRWKPRDGIEGQDCTIQGFTPGDNENKYIEEHQSLKALPAVNALEKL